MGVNSVKTILTARRLNEMSKEVSADRKRKTMKNEPGVNPVLKIWIMMGRRLSSWGQ